MITVVAASTITALKMRNLAVFDAGKFFHFRLAEVVAFYGVADLLILRLDAGNVEADILKDVQDSDSDALARDSIGLCRICAVVPFD